MSVSEDLINFDIIETQKENIQALPQGRSAKALATAFTPSPFSPLATPGATRNLNDTLRAEYEAELQTINDSDDPLDIYDRYVKWTFNAYPTAQATPESQLRPLLERATKQFQGTSTYKNDPRYLKLWIHYIRLFSDAPREIFAYLSRHGIGEGLALYYEEFAAWLEGAGRWTQAEEIYKLGIEREARPSERLWRKFGEFQKRCDARPANMDEPSSPALPTVRPALAAKLDPYATTTSRPEDPQAQRLPSAATSSRAGRQKIAIFADADGSLAGKSSAPDVSKGWDNIGSIRDRKKENMIEAKPWAGETLKTGKRVGTGTKIAVFRDQSTSDMNANPKQSQERTPSALVNLQETENSKTGKLERIVANLPDVYPSAIEEFCFAEVMAKKRGWSSRDWSIAERDEDLPRRTSQDPVLNLASPIRQASSSQELLEPSLIAEDHSQNDSIPETTQDLLRDEKTTKPRRKKIMEVKGETQTIKLNLSSPSSVKKVRRKSTAEPTMTLHSRAATDEVLDMFNQTLRDVGSITEEPHNAHDSDYEEDDYTSGGESTCNLTGRTSGPESDFGDETEALDRTYQSANGEETETLDKTSQSINGDSTGSQSVSAWSDFTQSKHIPKNLELDTSQPQVTADDELKTPVSPKLHEDSEHIGTQFMPSPPRDVQAPRHPYRDPEQINQNRLPFMTPIVEMTESSVSVPSSRRQGDYFNSKTPSRRRHEGDPAIPELEDLILNDDTMEFKHLPTVEEELLQPEPLIQFDDTVPSLSQPHADISAESSTLSYVHQLDAVEKESATLTSKVSETAIRVEQLSLNTSSKPLVAEPQPSCDNWDTIGRLERDVVIFDDHVNPIDEEVRRKIISALDPPLRGYPGFYDHKPTNSSIKFELDKLAKSQSKKPRSATEKPSNIEAEPLLVTAEDESFVVKQLLGKGGWASVFLAEKISNKVPTELQAMKSEFDPSAWEYSMMVLTQARLKQTSQSDCRRSMNSIATPLSFHSYADAGYMFESFHEQGNLLELVNRVKADALPAGSNTGASTPGLDEHLAMFFGIEILRTMADMHSVGIVHCDIKADNFLVRLDNVDEATDEWSSDYSPSGLQGWSKKGIVLIDFGRAIDSLAFKPDTTFYAEWATDKHDCPEQREARPWSFQADLWGVASILSVLLFGKVLEETTAVESSSGPSVASLPVNGNGTISKRYKPRDAFKRYWQTELWSEVFDVLMNPSQHATQSERVGRGTGGIKGLPSTKLRSIREQMEQYLVENGEKKGLKQSLKKLEEKLGSSAYNVSKRRA